MSKQTDSKETETKPELYTLLGAVSISTSDEFRTYHNLLLQKYDITFENNCDYWAQVTGNIYEKEGECICHITGIFYDEDGDWNGDLYGYLRLLEKSLYEKYRF